MLSSTPELPPEPPTVEAVVVTGARLPSSLGDPAFSVLQLGPRDLRRSPRLDEVLSQAPGVSLFRRTSSQGANPTTQGLSLRSIAPSGAGRALVTLDGVPQNDPFGGWVIWTGLPSEGVGTVNIVRGAAAQAYGAGALTGVVALTGRDGGAQPLRAEGALGGLGHARASLATGTPSRGGGLLLTASAERSKGWIPVREGRGSADTPLSLEAGAAALKYDGALGAVAVSARAAAYDENRQAGLAGADSRAQGAQASLTLARRPQGPHPGWRLQGWSLASDLENRSVATARDRSGTTPANDQFETPALGLGLNAAVRGVGTGREWEVGADVRLNAGESRERFRYMAGQFTRQREAGGRTLTAGLYASRTAVQGPWMLTGGLRADLWRSSEARRVERDLQTSAPTLELRPERVTEVVPSARAGLRRSFEGGWFARGVGYTGFRPPTLNELHRPFRVGNDITEANPGLRLERLVGGELGLGRTIGGFEAAATVFRKRLEDPVANVTIGVGPGVFPTVGFVPAGGVLRQRRNVGVIDAIGLEAEAERRWGDRLRLRGSVSYTDAEVDGGMEAPQLTGKRPAQAPRVTATAVFDWRATDRLTLAADVRHESARFEDDLNSRRLSAATSVDAEGSYRILPSTRVFLQLRNVLDEAVETGRTADGVVGYDAPRTVRLGLSFTG
jgi:outer membrane receptor protein involved in Fe transport